MREPHLRRAYIFALPLCALCLGGCGGSAEPPADPSSPAVETAPASEAATAAEDEPAASPQAPSDSASGTEGGEPASASATEGHRHPGETRTTAVIAQIIKDNRKKARACYEQAAKQIPGLAGDVTIHFVLDPEGAVQEAKLNQERSNITEPSLVTCIIDVIRSLPFPASSRGMETKVNYPFNFKP